MLTADAAAAGLWDQHVLLPIAVGEFQIRINSTPEKSGVVSPKILGALHPSAPSSPSPFSLFSKTGKKFLVGLQDTNLSSVWFPTL